MSKKVKPIWMPLYVTQFLADTAHLTAAQVGAYINLLCTMWNTKDGTLPNDTAALSRAGRVTPNNWRRTWQPLKPMFDIDGDLVTSADLQAERGKANALIVSRRAAGSIGGQTTQFYKRRSSHSEQTTLRASKPLKYNDGPQANAQANYNHNLKKEEGAGSPRPETGSPLPKEGLQEETPIITDKERQANLDKLRALKLELKRGAK